MKVPDSRNLKSLLVGMVAVFLVTPVAKAQTAVSGNPFGACAKAPANQAKLTKYSLYYENFKNDDYKAALPYLRWMIRCAPTFGGRPNAPSAKNINRAIEAYVGMSEAASSEEDSHAYMDTALTLIDTAPSILNEGGVETSKFEWTFRRGRFLQVHRDLLPDMQAEAIAAYRKAYERSPDKLLAKDTTYYFNEMLRDYVKRGETAKMLRLVQDLQKRYGDNVQITGLIDKYLPRIPPEERLSFYEKRLADNPDDVALMQKLMELYRNLGRRDKMYELGERLQEMDPSPGVSRTLAQMYLQDGEPRKAIDLYQNLISMEGVDVQAEDYYNMGLAYKSMGSLSKARTYFRNATEVDAGFGRAYLAIGDLYATAVSNCGSMEREDKAVYWLATDYYQKAKRVRPSLSSTANSKIGTYQKYYPSKEDLFFWDKTNGDSYRVDSGCYAWINETTTVRNP